MPRKKLGPLTSTPVKSVEDSRNGQNDISYSEINQLSSNMYILTDIKKDLNKRKNELETDKESTDGTSSSPYKKYDLRSFRMLIDVKRRNIAKLQQEYEEIRTTSSSKQDTKLHSLNGEYLHLKAKNIVLDSRHPITVPNYECLLYSWAHTRLNRDTHHLMELLSFQKTKKKIAFEKKEDLQQLFERQELECTLPATYEELLENEKIKREILQCLHSKLIRRLRRLSRNYYPSAIVRNEKHLGSKKLKIKSMFSFLKELLIDLKDISTKPEEWEKSRLVEVDSSICENYVDILINENVIKSLEENSSYIKLADR